MNFEKKLKKNNILLPKAADPVGSYVASKIIGKLLYISGQISMDAEGKLIKGKVGKDLDVDKGYKAAERCALSIVSQAKKACDNDLSKIKSCVKSITRVIETVLDGDSLYVTLISSIHNLNFNS